ncbi:unnamed protein product [Owenia fusiformis]|uniref:UBC core domain-containing protein n=1 Tax=Owenia fusiformis TaxID=6347 RepID=A0A8J1TT50_OWEFU|nr:unnamed protein product [Owenia fusiformis]
MHKSKNIFILLTCLFIIFSAKVVRGDSATKSSAKGDEGSSNTTWIVTAVFGVLTIVALGSVCSKRNQQTPPPRVAKESVREARLARFQPSNTQQNNSEKKRDQNGSPETQIKKPKAKPQLNIEIRDPGKGQNKITGDSNDGTCSEKSVKFDIDTAEKTLKREPPKRAELNVRNSEKQSCGTSSHDYDSEYDEAILAAINDLNLDNEAVVTSIDSQTPGLGVDSGDGSQFVFPSIESQPTSTITEEVSVSTTKSTPSSLKSQVPKESPADEDAKVPPLPNLFINTLSHILDTQIKVQERDRNESRDRNVMFIKEANVAQNAKDVSKKSLIIFTRRMAREYVGKMRYCIQCYERMGCVQFGRTEIVADIKTSLTDAVAMTILSELNEDLQGSSEDDLWSDVGGKNNVDESGPLTELLLRVSGWSDDDVTIATDLLQHILKMATKDESKEKGILKLISVAAQHIKSTKRLDETMLYQRKFFQALENLASQATFIEILVKELKCEIEKSETALGIYFEENGIFGELLSLTTIPVGLQEIKRPDPITSAPFLELRGFPRASLDDMKFLENNIQGVFHRTQKIVFDMVKKMLKCDRTAVLSWLAAVVTSNELRASANPLIHEEITNTACSDGFMLNLCTVLLELCMPFCHDVTKLTKIDASYAGSTSCRLNYNLETCLASGQIVQEESDMKEKAECENVQDSFNFMTEIFHITQRALNVGTLSATNTFLHNNQSLARAFHAQWKGTPQEQELNNRIILWGMKWDCHLLDPEMLRKTSEFYLAQAQWLLLQLSNCEQKSTSTEDLRKQQANAFSHVPEYTVKDMARWFSFMANRGLRVHKGVLTGLQISPFIDCCVMLLERHDLMPGPVCATKIIETLYAFIQTGGSTNDMSRRGGWGSGLMSELGSMVHTCPTVRNSLGPALLHTFVSVDVVEGLDVDKEDFEKYRSRHEISKLIEHLWNRQDCRTSILALCGQPIFQKFLGAILDELLFMLHDGLGTLSSVRRLEQAKANESEWNKQTPQQQQDKEKFLKAEEARAAGAMNMANNLMAFLELLTKSEDVARCLTMLPLAQRAANAILGFVEKLCGPNSLDFKVKDMNKYKFTPRILLKQIVEIILMVTREESSRSEGFLVSMATDPDFNDAMFEKAVQVIGREGLTEEATLKEFQEVLQVVIKLKEEKQSESQAGHHIEATYNWEDEITKLEINEETYADAYTKSLENYTFDSADLQDCHSYTSNFGDKPVDPRAPKLKAFRKELKQLQDLPLNIHAAIFIRQDEDRIDMLRALVTGPSGTPYSGGCFCFDIYLPNNYPNIPPLVKFITTGNGTVRFNPNLYSDGKVCLSLLGTWHGGNASEKWNPQTSSIYQVLMSIQSLILISDPMYNEPGQEGLQGTTEGDMRSEAYNQNIRLYTIRHAMLGQLRHPTKGFESVIRRHFKVQRDLILKQCSDWLKRCDDSGIEKRMRRCIDELCTEIDNIEIEEEETCDDSEDGSLED